MQNLDHFAMSTGDLGTGIYRSKMMNDETGIESRICDDQLDGSSLHSEYVVSDFQESQVSLQLGGRLNCLFQNKIFA